MAYFEELDDILNNVIGEKILRNQNLCKLLTCYSDTYPNYSYDPLAEPDIEDTSSLLMTHVFPLPKLPGTKTENLPYPEQGATMLQKAYLTVVLTAGNRDFNDINTGFRRMHLVFDIIVHLNEWIIKDSFRPYKIAAEIDKMLNYQMTDLPIFSKPVSNSFQQRDYSNYYYGLQLIYGFPVNSNIVCDPTPQNLNIREKLYGNTNF